MSFCPICGRVYCDHTPEERGQTDEEMMRPLTPEEEEAWKTEPPIGTPKKIALGKKNAHLPVRKAKKPRRKQ